MSKRYVFLLAAFILSAARLPTQAQDDEARRKPAVYLRSPGERLSRLASAIGISATRKAKVRLLLSQEEPAQE